MDGEQISSQIYAYYVYCAYEMYGYYELIDPEVPLKKQEIPVKDKNGEITYVRADKQINERALEQTLYLHELKKQFDAAGLTISEERTKELKELAAYEYESYAGLFEHLGITEETVLLASVGGMFTEMEDALFLHTFGTGGENEVPQDEFLDYYNKNYISYAYVSQKLLDAQGIPLDEAGKDAIRAEMKGIVNKVENGSVDLEQLAIDYISAYSKDNTCGKGGKNLSTVTIGESELMQSLEQMSFGDVMYVEIKNTGYVIKKYDLLKVGFLDKEENRISVLKNMKYDDWNAQLASKAMENYTLNGSAFRKYSINNINVEDVA